MTTFFPFLFSSFKQGDTVEFRIKYSTSLGGGVGGHNDTLRVQIYPQLNQVFKLSADSLVKLPENSDGTTSIFVIIPNSQDLGDSRFYITHVNFPEYFPFSLIENPTSIINPITEKDIKIYYFDTLGNEVKRPTEGLFIWKSESGESGKVYIVK